MLSDELRAKDVLDQLGTIVLVVAPDGAIVYGNEAAVFAYGYSPEALTKLHISAIRDSSDDDAVIREQLQRAAEGGVCFEAVHRRVDGRTFAVEVSSRPLETPTGTVLISLVTDITGRIAAHRALRESEQRFRLLAENSTDVTVHIVSGGVVSWASPSVTDALGWDPRELVGMRFVELVYPDDHDRFFAGRSAIASEGEAFIRYRALAKDGNYCWVESHAKPYMNAEGEREGVLAVIRVLDAQDNAEEELQRLARCDELTGVLSGEEALGRLRVMATKAARADRRVAVMCCDVDHLAAINERYGDSGGDTILRQLARRMRAGVRGSDLVGRLGEDEFLIALVDVREASNARRIAEKIRVTVSEPVGIGDDEVMPSLSIGVVVVREAEEIEASMARAHKALADAKAAGCGRVALG